MYESDLNRMQRREIENEKEDEDERYDNYNQFS